MKRVYLIHVLILMLVGAVSYISISIFSKAFASKMERTQTEIRNSDATPADKFAILKSIGVVQEAVTSFVVPLFLTTFTLNLILLSYMSNIVKRIDRRGDQSYKPSHK
jgi:hypothetical protein